MRIKILAIAAIFSLFYTAAFAQDADGDWYTGKPVKDISFEGLKNVSPADLEGVTKPYKGKTFTDELYWEVLQKVYALDFFSDVNTVAIPGDSQSNSVIIRFIVTERPVIRSLTLNGYK